MSLIVCPYKIVNNEISYLKDMPVYPQNDLFGTEKSRHTIWSSKYLLNIGCKILPRLRNEDLFCDGEELKELEKELNLILSHIDELNEKLGINDEYLLFRIKNAIGAIEIANKYEKDGGVYIG